MRAYSLTLSTMQWNRLRMEIDAATDEPKGMLATLVNQIGKVNKHDSRHAIPYDEGLPAGWQQGAGVCADLGKYSGLK